MLVEPLPKGDFLAACEPRIPVGLEGLRVPADAVCRKEYAVLGLDFDTIIEFSGQNELDGVSGFPLDSLIVA